MILWFSFQISLVHWVVYRKATYFIFTLNPETLLKSLVLGFFFFFQFFQIFYLGHMSSVNKDSFMLFSPVCISFISFLRSIVAFTGTSSVMVKQSSERDILALYLTLVGKLQVSYH